MDPNINFQWLKQLYKIIDMRNLTIEMITGFIIYIAWFLLFALKCKRNRKTINHLPCISMLAFQSNLFQKCQFILPPHREVQVIWWWYQLHLRKHLLSSNLMLDHLHKYNYGCHAKLQCLSFSSGNIKCIFKFYLVLLHFNVRLICH